MGFFTKLKNWFVGKGFKDDLKQEESVDKVDVETRKRDEPAIPVDSLVQKNKIAEDLEPTRMQQVDDANTHHDVTPGIKKSVDEVDVKTRKRNEPVVPVDERSDVQKVVKQIGSKGKISDVESKIRIDGNNDISFQPTTDLNQLNQVYNHLFTKNNISVIRSDGSIDTALLQVLIDNRQKLQHRFSAEILVMTDSSVGMIYIDGILAENLYVVSEYIEIGRTYTSEELKVAMNNLLNRCENDFGSVGGDVKAPMEKKSRVVDVQVKMNFQ